MICEVCGKEMPFTRCVIIEGSIMRACSECSRFGRDADPRAQAPVGSQRVVGGVYLKPSRSIVKDIYTEMGDTDLANDFGARIRKARTSLGLKQEELGQKINERKSVIEQLENGRIRPDDKLISKLEKSLNIKLREKIVETQVETRKGQSELTLGDLIKDEK